MENLITIKNEYNSLDTLCSFLKSQSAYECSKIYDTWEVKVDSQGQMAQCLLLKKSNMHAMKIAFANNDTVKVNHIIPNKLMNAFFGKNVKARRNIMEILGGTIKQTLLKSSQEKAFTELEAIVVKAS